MRHLARTCFGLIIVTGITISCVSEQKKDNTDLKQEISYKEGSFRYDLDFLEKHQKPIVLIAPDNAESKAILIAAYQGRVMTTTASGDSGNSYGWINYELIRSGEMRKHMNAFGGEDRLWLSPEGGQFSVYFKKGDKFEFENWQTPAVIDSELFDIVDQDSSSVSFQKKTHQTNYSGTEFDMTIRRKVSMLSKKQVSEYLGINLSEKLRQTAYESENEIVNEGNDWSKDSGVLGLWILGMFRPSDKTVIIAPFNSHISPKPKLTSDYFGKIPGDRLQQNSSAIFLKADGKFRSKIGLEAVSSTSLAGSYDPSKGLLTIVQFDMDVKGQYLKSSWKIHDNPYGGDALNAYNDGPLEDGTQMGPFYELESSSKAVALKNKEKLIHRHRTYHFEGEKDELNRISEKLLGVKLDEVKHVFK